MKGKEKYKRKDWDLRYRESMVDSVCNLDGKFFLFKKSIFSEFPKNALVDDYFMTFAIKEKGYRLIVDRAAEVYEKLEGEIKEEIGQFKRYATSALIINFKNIKFLFNPKYGYFGLLTFPFRRFFPLFYPLFLLYSIIFLSISGVSLISKLNILTIIFIFGLIFLFLLLFILFLWFRRRFSLIQLWAVALSYVDLFKKNDLKIGKWETFRKK
jgi:cellulose synthase/poly-beta-1,6-N-acetylglucosamine synthase-like glycosyltransferase